MIVHEIVSTLQPNGDNGPAIGVKFQEVIRSEIERGRKLHSWNLGQVFDSTNGRYTDTIVAVFEADPNL